MSASVFEQRWLGMEGIFGGFVLGRVVDAADTVENQIELLAQRQATSASSPAYSATLLGRHLVHATAASCPCRSGR